MKKFFKILILAIFIFSSYTSVFASTNTKKRTENDYLVPADVIVDQSNKTDVMETPAVDEKEKVYDFADLFTDTEENDIYLKINEFITTYDMDLAIVTISSNPKYSEVEYADDFYDYNNFNDNGILFLIDMDNRQIYMSTTGTAINMYNDNRINYLMDSIYKYISNKSYSKGTLEYIKMLSSLASEGYPTGNEIYQSTSSKVLKSMFFSFIITVIVMVILISKNKLVRKASDAKEFLEKDSIKITQLGDILIDTHTETYRINNNSNGGSSTHSSSSSRSHGGGGHRF